jgi:pheophorbide a oxygenase
MMLSHASAGGGANSTKQRINFRDRASRPSSLPLRRNLCAVTRRSVPDRAATSAATTTATTTTRAETTTTASAQTPPPPPTPTKPADGADANAAPSSPPSPAQNLFDWRRCWYPVALVESLHTDRPNALKLLGEPLVAWRPLSAGSAGGGGGGKKEGDGGWVVARDACPHRLAPLSEGRLETDGTLQW